jgi:protein phosphatase
MAEPIANWKNFIEHAELSDVGLRRSNNQDSMAVSMAGDEWNWLSRGHLFVVADGMGAHAAGELASKMAANSIPHTYNKLADRPAPDALRQAIVEANEQIHNRGQASSDFNGMGTTTSTLALLPQGAIVAHVGDSRVYRLRGNTLQQLTFDHSLVWEMRAAGHFAGNEPPAFVPKNIITRSLGPHPEVNIDLEGPFPLEVGDTFLLCSDGLSGQVTDEELGLVMGAMSPQEAVRMLVDLANLRGGPDNITVLIVRVVGRVQPERLTELPKSFSVRRQDRPSVHPALWVGIGASLLLGALLGTLGFTVSASVFGLLAVIGGLVAIIKRSSDVELESNGMPQGALGRGPHTTFNCTPSVESLASIHQVLVKLRTAAVDEHWDVRWPEFDAICQRASSATKAGKYGLAVRETGLAISFMVAEVRRQRNKKNRDSSVFE